MFRTSRINLRTSGDLSQVHFGFTTFFRFRVLCSTCLSIRLTPLSINALPSTFSRQKPWKFRTNFFAYPSCISSRCSLSCSPIRVSYWKFLRNREKLKVRNFYDYWKLVRRKAWKTRSCVGFDIMSLINTYKHFTRLVFQIS